MSEKRRIKLHEIKSGKLEQAIYNRKGQLFLPRGALLTAEMVAALRKRGVTEVFVLDDGPEENKLSGSKSSSRQELEGIPLAEVYNKALDYVKLFMTELVQGKLVNIDALNRAISLFIYNYFSDIELLEQMKGIQGKDSYLYTHSINVAVLCIMMGRWLGWDHDMVKKLGVAGCLHDIGKVCIPEEILNKPAQLTSQEYEIMKTHSLIGYALLNKCHQVESSIQQAVLLHHQRLDGSGYPVETDCGKIPTVASVVAVADTYDAITSHRVYSSKRTPYTAVEEILKEAIAGKLDLRISKIFYDRLLDLSVGNMVLLSNQEKGEIVFMNPLKPSRPVVKVGDQLYNLSKIEYLYIAEHL